MAAADEIKSRLDINQVASMLGTDPGTADQAVDEALSSLLGRLSGNADNADEAVNLTRALGDHTESDAFGTAAGAVDLSRVDAADGEKIVDHVYGAAQPQQASGGVEGLVRKLLPLLAPLVMSYLASRLQDYLGRRGGQGGTGAGSDPLSDILGGVLGGRQSGQGGGSGNPLEDILGSVLGRGQSRGGQPDEASVDQQQAQPQQPAGAGDGVFRTPAGGAGSGLRIPGDDADAAASDQAGASDQPAARGPLGGVLGGILKDLLSGR